MATIYSHCSADVVDLAGELIATHFPDITESKLSVDYVFAEPEPEDNGEKREVNLVFGVFKDQDLRKLSEKSEVKISSNKIEATVLKLNGYPCIAICKPLPGKRRALGSGDVEISIDKLRWELMPDLRRRALLHHELRHIIVRRDGNGDIVTDEYDRPKVGMRKHPVQVGWFPEVAAIYGSASFECEQAQKIMEDFGTVLFQNEFGFIATESMTAKR